MNVEANILAVVGGAAAAGATLAALARVLGRLRRRRSSWGGRCRRMALRPVRWRFAIAMAATSAWGFLLLQAAARAGWFVPLDVNPDTGLTSLLAQTLLLPLAGLAAVAVCMHAENASAAEAFGLEARRWRFGLRQAPLFYAAAIPVVVAVAVAWRLVMDGLGIPLPPQPLVELLRGGRLPPGTIVYLSVLAMTVAPVAEEVLFRGLLLPLLLRHYGPVQSVAIVSLMFAGLHLNVASLLPLCAISAAFAAGYLWTGSLATPILMHALFNGVNLALMALGVGG